MPDERTGEGRRVFTLGIKLAAAVWGFAEATLFFIVPDVLLTWVALDRPRTALVCCLTAAFGAMLGGALMFAWGGADTAAALDALAYVPAVSSEMIVSAGERLRDDGWFALLRGSVSGVPYKIFAVQAGVQGVSLLAFLLVSIPARLVRFVAVTFATASLSCVFSGSSLAVRRAIHITAWVVFYTWFFWKMT